MIGAERFFNKELLMSQHTRYGRYGAARRWMAGGVAVVGTVLLCGCSIAPTRVSPSTSLANASKCASAAAPASAASYEEVQAAVSTHSLALLTTYVANLEVNRKRVVMQDVPDDMKGDNVVDSISLLLVHQNLTSVKSLVDQEIIANRSKIDDASVQTWNRAISQAISDSVPKSLSSGDFKNFFQKIVSPNSSAKKSRIVLYESYYFNGTFVDRFGSKLGKPTLSLTITDQEISGALTAFIEALADDLFPQTKVWTGTGGKYYPGGTTNKPSFLQYSEDTSGSSTSLTQALVDKGCGMTELKAQVLNYLSGKAATWAAGESGVVMGFVGGANVGLLVIFGKLSIGDNKALQTIVQTVLSTAAKRATFEATIPILLAIDQQSSHLQDIIDQLLFKQTS
jgi:hypothetical protein